MIEVSNFSYTYPTGIKALKRINLSINPGEFVLLSGSNGGGKSTLLNAILGILDVYWEGTIKGSIKFDNKPVKEYGITHLAGKVGIVLQDPESQICNLTVWEEVTSALCNLLYPKSKVIAFGNEELSRMHLENQKELSVDSLSGGQLQRLAIASLLAIKPKVLIFDEPLANLDPLGVASFVEALNFLREQVEIIIVASHWLDPFLELASRVVILEKGEIAVDSPISNLTGYLTEFKKFNVEIPQIWSLRSVLSLQGVPSESLEGTIHLPKGLTIKPLKEEKQLSGETFISLKQVGYTYPDGTVTLRDISTLLGRWTRTALVGPNGAGKTTLARILAGIRKPTQGNIETKANRVATMLQKPSLGFITDTVYNELFFEGGFSDSEVTFLLRRFNLEMYRNSSPFQLSGGEQRRLSLAIALVNHHDLLILDEPTAGLDSLQVRFLESELENYDGTSVFITHDQRVIGSFVRNVIVLNKGHVTFSGPTTRLSAQMLFDLGYPDISPTINLSTRYLKEGIPMIPEQVEVMYANSI